MKPLILAAVIAYITAGTILASPRDIVESSKISEFFREAGLTALPTGASSEIRQTYAKGGTAYYHIKIDASLSRVVSILPKITEKIKTEIKKDGLNIRGETPIQTGISKSDYMYQVIFDSKKKKGCISMSVIETPEGSLLIISSFEVD